MLHVLQCSCTLASTHCPELFPGHISIQGRGEGRLIRRRRWQAKLKAKREALRQKKAEQRAAIKVRTQNPSITVLRVE